MRQKRHTALPALVLTLVLVLTLLMPAGAAAEAPGQLADALPSGTANRFNVMLVLDASVSMNESDARGLRYEAIRLFNNLLPNEGNSLGGVVFSTAVDRETGPEPVNGPSEKDAVVRTIRDVPAPGGWTNIGAGLDTALDRLEEKGNPELPSVIILLSDGNTAMYTDELTRAAAGVRDEAVRRAREAEVPVYSICLNCNGTADSSEMERISDETGGVFTEVRRAEDLNRVFEVFYELIYRSSSVTLADGVFPPDGVLDTPFEVPGFGVEEVNVVFQGYASEAALTRPDGSVYEAEMQRYETFSAIKMTEIIPGEWSLRTKGISGDRIRIEVIYNTNLTVTLYLNPEGEELDPVEPVNFTARLSAGETEAGDYEDYLGFEAELVTYGPDGAELERLPMTVGNNGFEARSRFEEGTYTFETVVTGNSLNKASERVGPIRFVTPERPAATPTPAPTPTPTPTPNTAPAADPRTVQKTVLIWPVIGGNLRLNMNTLVSDREGDVLRYTASSADLEEGREYTLSSTGSLNVKLGSFRLENGSVDIRATDAGGLSCDVTVRVRPVNTVVILLVLLALGLVWLLFLILRRREPRKAIRGDITVTSEVDGVVKTAAPRAPAKKGRYPLSNFAEIDPVGLDYSRCYFEAGSDAYIFLVTDRNVWWRGYETDSVRIDSGAETTVRIDEEGTRQLRIRFDSDTLDVGDADYDDF
jgi:secreted protein with Ig-like and vWFA domain